MGTRKPLTGPLQSGFGAVQGSLADRVGMSMALVLASVLFGAAHLITWTYAIIAAFIGAYLGLL